MVGRIGHFKSRLFCSDNHMPFCIIIITYAILYYFYHMPFCIVIITHAILYYFYHMPFCIIIINIIIIIIIINTIIIIIIIFITYLRQPEARGSAGDARKTN